ncbi:hypothetical protein GCM10007420_09610 [Glycocaulis albus]|uniref:Uncharacterized protein n=1 Tax=Glycocaulis albus TaxID=1382801 RepID=A0ABQ1XKK6_9PROT|nr:hypothetical protein GCM10007420_09610 [Glycocaulis albus]
MPCWTEGPGVPLVAPQADKSSAAPATQTAMRESRDIGTSAELGNTDCVMDRVLITAAAGTAPGCVSRQSYRCDRSGATADLTIPAAWREC